ncbi:MAG: acyl-CoA thioesterase [Zoogloeaceae bacterium]|jgi:acyl-CoA thioesterase YciA|nr:acyl-CoA thioesterase [Zoogloeaceae bacterium]
MIDEPTHCPERQPALRLAPMPGNENMFGDIFGGWVMSNVDIAGGIEAMRYARGRVATVAVNSFQFQQPISSGDVVSFYAEVIHAGRTSITVQVQVFAERHPQKPIVVKVTEAILTYVALDDEGQKRALPTAVWPELTDAPES